MVKSDKSSANKVKKEGPKKNKTSYMYFYSEERENIKQEKNTLNNKEITVELCARWKVVKEEKSERYNKFVALAEQDKIRYENEKKIFKK